MTAFRHGELHTLPVTFKGAPYSHKFFKRKGGGSWRAVRLWNSPVPHRIPAGPDWDTHNPKLADFGPAWASIAADRTPSWGGLLAREGTMYRI